MTKVFASRRDYEEGRLDVMLRLAEVIGGTLTIRDGGTSIEDKLLHKVWVLRQLYGLTERLVKEIEEAREELKKLRAEKAASTSVETNP
jgi:hypothetical protein